MEPTLLQTLAQALDHVTVEDVFIVAFTHPDTVPDNVVCLTEEQARRFALDEMYHTLTEMAEDDASPGRCLDLSREELRMALMLWHDSLCMEEQDATRGWSTPLALAPAVFDDFAFRWEEEYQESVRITRVPMRLEKTVKSQIEGDMGGAFVRAINDLQDTLAALREVVFDRWVTYLTAR